MSSPLVYVESSVISYLATWNFSHFVGSEPRHKIMLALNQWGYEGAILTTPEELFEGAKS